MKVVILCGGIGIRLRDQIDFKPKALVLLDDKPIIWHIMKRYSLFGFNEFILALGKHDDMIRDYFLDYNLYTNDIEFTIGKAKNIKYHNLNQEEKWKVTLVNTGEEARTGARLARCKNFLEGDFMLTYSDCLCDVDLDKVLKQHKQNKKIVTVTGVMPPFRYGEFVIKNGKVVDFYPVSKLKASQGFVNGGYMVMTPKIFDYLSMYNECTLEGEVFKKLAEEQKLDIYKHEDFWQCLDNDRDLDYIKQLCLSNKRYWLE